MGIYYKDYKLPTHLYTNSICCRGGNYWATNLVSLNAAPLHPRHPFPMRRSKNHGP